MKKDQYALLLPEGRRDLINRVQGSCKCTVVTRSRMRVAVFALTSEELLGAVSMIRRVAGIPDSKVCV
jgi:hypothetical protein